MSESAARAACDASGVLVAMVDTNVFDAIADDEVLRARAAAAIAHKRLRLVTTPVQEAQLAAVPDPYRRKLLRTLPRDVVPTAEVVTPDHPKHVADSAIADSTSAHADVLVTQDRRLGERARERGLEVWSVGRLADEIAALERSPLP